MASWLGFMGILHNMALFQVCDTIICLNLCIYLKVGSFIWKWLRIHVNISVIGAEIVQQFHVHVLEIWVPRYCANPYNATSILQPSSNWILMEHFQETPENGGKIVKTMVSWCFPCSFSMLFPSNFTRLKPPLPSPGRSSPGWVPGRVA